MSTLTVAGEGLELVLSVGGYEFEAAEEEDLDWLTGSARLTLETWDAGLTARCDLFWRAGELVAFEQQLRAALAARESRRGAVAELTTLEDQIQLQIQVRFGEARITGRIDHEVVGLEFGCVATTAEQLDRSLAELAEVTRRFPPRT